ncbi:MAG: efflux RND transporter periplasmic adaptor subunit [Vicinamibacteria bacterium]
MNPLRHLQNRKLLAVVGFVAFLLLVALWPQSVAVDLAAVERGALLITVDEEGETRVRDRFLVSAPVAGQVLRIALEPGDRVDKGETLLATFLPAAPNPLDARSRAEAEAAVAAARAALGGARAEEKRAEAALTLARSELERHQQLFEQRIVSQRAKDAAETEAQGTAEALHAAEFAMASAEHQLEMAQARLLQASGGSGGRPIEIRSPIDGVVFKRYRWSEAVVPAGEPLLELGDPRRLEIVSDLLSTDAVRVNPGDTVLIEQWGGDETLQGSVRLVEPSGFMKISALGVEEQRVNVIVDFEDPAKAWEKLGDGYRVEVRVVIWESEDVVKVPTSSLFRKGRDWAVFAVDSGRARLVPIEVGQRNGLEAQVLSGLEAGQQVVVHPSDTLEDGARVQPRT